VLILREITGREVADLYPTLRPSFDRRISAWAQDRLRTGATVIAVVALPDAAPYDPARVLGLCAVIVDPQGVERGVTVVGRAYRNQGIGAALLRHRTALHPGVVSRVWDRNAASLRMCAKAGHGVQGEEVHAGKRILLVAPATDITRCSICDEPAHASEMDDFDRHPACVADLIAWMEAALRAGAPPWFAAEARDDPTLN
jgi:GNAT superfamily N-acetyltransferase